MTLAAFSEGQLSQKAPAIWDRYAPYNIARGFAPQEM
jgi:hypothetical protein